MTGRVEPPPRSEGFKAVEALLGRFLIALTYLAVILLVIGVGILLATGRSPLDGGPDLELSRLWDELLSFDAPALLWLGLIAVIATPVGRVVLAGAAFARQRDWLMLCVAAAILAIMVVGVLIAGAGTV
jgi:uncharacterized membrane protein